MISKHCGQSLMRVTEDRQFLYSLGSKRATKHQWRCRVCGRRFEQKIRLPKELAHV